MHLHWLPVCLRIKFKIILLTYKALHNCAPLYTKDLIDPYVPARCLRSSSHILLQQPRFNLQTYGGRAFSVASPAAPLTYFNDWGMGGGGGGGGGWKGPTEVHILYPKKSHLQNLSTQKTTTLFSIPKKSLSPFFATPKKSLCFFFATQKNPGIFHKPKKITFGQNFRSKKVEMSKTVPQLPYSKEEAFY